MRTQTGRMAPGDQESTSGRNGLEDEDDETDEGLFHHLVTSGCWRLFPLILLTVSSVTTITPLYPGFLTDFFASRHSHLKLHCDGYSGGSAPTACQQAHSDVVTYQSISDFILNSVILFMLAPLLGRMSDVVGRRPLLLLYFVLSTLPFAMIALHINFGLSLFFYFPARAMNGVAPMLSLGFTIAADLTPSKQRAAAFGLVLASSGVGMLVGPLLGGLVQPILATRVAAGALALCLLWTCFGVKESLSKDDREKATAKHMAEGKHAWQSLSILVRKPLFVKLTVVLMTLAFTSGGFSTLYSQFFQANLGFRAADQSQVIITAGLASLVGQTVVLRGLMRLVGETRLLAIGCIGMAAGYAILALAPNKPVALIGVAVTCVGDLAQPAISSIMSKHVAHHEQGSVQGAIAGANSFAYGIGPCLSAALYSAFSHHGSHLPYFLGAPLLVMTALALLGLAVAASIDAPYADRGAAPDEGDDEPSLSEPLLDGI